MQTLEHTLERAPRVALSREHFFGQHGWFFNQMGQSYEEALLNRSTGRSYPNEAAHLLHQRIGNRQQYMNALWEASTQSLNVPEYWQDIFEQMLKELQHLAIFAQVMRALHEQLAYKWLEGVAEDKGFSGLFLQFIEVINTKKSMQCEVQKKWRYTEKRVANQRVIEKKTRQEMELGGKIADRLKFADLEGILTVR